jgi:outer membrane protein W
MRKVFVGVCMVSMVSLSMAQHLEVEVDGGYGLGVETALVGANMIFDAGYTTTKYEEVYASGGAGLKMMGEVTYFLNDNIGIMAASGYSMLGKYATGSVGTSDTTHDTTTSSYLPINIGVKFKAKMGIIEPYLYLAPGMYFPKKISTIIHSSITGWDTTKVTYYYALGWGVSAGVGAVLMVSEKVGINLEIMSTYAFAKQTKYVQKGGPKPGTYFYKDNTPVLKDDPANNTYYLHDAPLDSYSSVAVKAGVCFKIF